MAIRDRLEQSREIEISREQRNSSRLVAGFEGGVYYLSEARIVRLRLFLASEDSPLPLLA